MFDDPLLELLCWLMADLVAFGLGWGLRALFESDDWRTDDHLDD